MKICGKCNNTGIDPKSTQADVGSGKGYISAGCDCEIGDAYSAGLDCAISGANKKNCHFTIFSSPQKTAAWEKGKKDGENT